MQSWKRRFSSHSCTSFSGADVEKTVEIPQLQLRCWTLLHTCLSFRNDRCRGWSRQCSKLWRLRSWRLSTGFFFLGRVHRYTAGLTPAVRAGKGWRGRRELAPRCSATLLAARRHDPGQTRRVLNPPYHTHHTTLQYTTSPHHTPHHTPHHNTPHHTTTQHTVSSYSAQCLVRQWIQICVSLRSSFVLQRNAWFDSGYICRARRGVGIGMVFASLLVTMIVRCVHFVVGRPVESSQVHSLRQFQLLALPAGMWGRFCGGLCKGTGPGVMSTGT